MTERNDEIRRGTVFRFPLGLSDEHTAYLDMLKPTDDTVAPCKLNYGYISPAAWHYSDNIHLYDPIEHCLPSFIVPNYWFASVYTRF